MAYEITRYNRVRIYVDLLMMQLYSFSCPNQGLVSEQTLLGTFPKFGTLVFLVGS